MSDLKDSESKDVEPPQQPSSISADGDTRSQAEQVSRKIDRSKAHLTAGEIKRPWQMNLDELKALTGGLDSSKALLAAAGITRPWQMDRDELKALAGGLDSSKALLAAVGGMQPWQMDRDKLQALGGGLDSSKAHLAAAEVTRQWQMDRDKLKALVGGLDSSKAYLAAAEVTWQWQMDRDKLKALMGGLDSSKALLAAVGVTRPWQMDRDKLQALVGGLDSSKAYLAAAGMTRQWQMERDKLKSLVGGLDSSKALLAVAGVMRPWQVGGDELKALVASTFVGSKAFQALVNADSATLSAVAAGLSTQDEFVNSALAVSDFASLEVSSPLESAEAEVVSALTGGGDVSGLSSRASGLLRYVFWAFMLLMNYLAVQNGVREELCFLQPKLMPGLTVGQAGKAIRAVMCEGEVPEEFLRNYRMVKGEGVRLRVEPSMKAALVQVSLEDRALLEILDSSNRDWLYVSVVAEEGVHGWISRKYTHQLLK